MTYQVKLQDFEGPLDLLLHLIRKNELDIYNVPVAEIAGKYLEYVSVLESLNLDGVGDFLVMAATLAYHKSKMLLPSPAEVEDDEDDEFESLEALRLRLIEYQRYKEVGQALGERELLNRDVFKVRIFPIEPHGKKRVTISYTQILKSDAGLVSYVYPLNTEKFSAKPIKSVSKKINQGCT